MSEFEDRSISNKQDNERPEMNSVSHLTEWDELTVTWEPTADDWQAYSRINEDRTWLEITENANTKGVTLRSRHYVGNVGFPSGHTIVIEPKAAGDNLPELFNLVDQTETSFNYPTQITPGEKFFEPVVEAYLKRLEEICIHRKLDSDTYVRKGKRGPEINPDFNPASLNRKPFQSKREDFGTKPNQLLLAALEIIDKKYDVRDEIERRIDKTRNRLLQFQGLSRCRQPQQLADDVDRLITSLRKESKEYKEALRIAANIVNEEFIDTIDVEDTVANSFLTNMNVLFERVVAVILETAIKREESYQVIAHDRSTTLTQNSSDITVQPDVVIKNRDGTPILVADAKWKTDISVADRNQMVTYSVAYDCPVILFLPDQNGDNSQTYDLRNGQTLHIRELPTDTTKRKQEFREELIQTPANVLRSILDNDSAAGAKI